MSDQDDKSVRKYVIPAALFAILAGYMMVTGKLPIDKRQTVVITRASDPLIYWPVLLVALTIAGLCIRKIWKGLMHGDE